MLAEVVRLDHVHHQQVAGDSPIAEAVKLLGRAHQGLIWDRTRQVLRLRSALREFFSAALQAFEDLAAGEALELLDRAPNPDRAARLPRLTIAAALRRAGRRDLKGRATVIQQRLKGEQREPKCRGLATVLAVPGPPTLTGGGGGGKKVTGRATAPAVHGMPRLLARSW